MEEDKKDEITPTQEGVLREQIEHDEAIFQENDGEMLRQPEEEEALRLRKLQEEVASHSPQQEITPTLPEGSNQLAQEEQLERFRIFEALQRIVRDNPKSDGKPVHVFSGGNVDVVDLANIMEGKTYVDMAKLKKGDALVITTDSGSKFLFHIRQNIEEGKEQAIGDLRRIDKEGKSKDYLNMRFQGSMIGNMVSQNRAFVDGMPIRFGYPSPIEGMTPEQVKEYADVNGQESILPRILRTSPVKNIDIVKSEMLEVTPPSNN